VRRDWNRFDRADLLARVRQPVDVKVAMAVALYEAAKATLPGWPTDEDRRRDLAHHQAYCGTLRRAFGGGAR
jgi:hypothetical protein